MRKTLFGFLALATLLIGFRKKENVVPTLYETVGI
jgi:hypothetical protein